jgi:D-3-phosphoglycerate dehydrogenase / 2-oxoglutarate reductase
MKILILSSVDPRAIERLEREHDVVCAFGSEGEQLESLVRDREVVVFRSGVTLSERVMRRAPGLRLLIRAGSGFDNVDLDHVTGRGLAFIRIPEPGARAVAELTFGLMLALARNIVIADAHWRRGRWVKGELHSVLLRGKVLGVVGAGSIGTQVGALGAAWGMEVLGCVKHPSPTAGRLLEEKGLRLATFEEVVERSDFLSIHLPLDTSTVNLFDASVLSRMKPGSFLLNLARGGVVDELALRDELQSGQRLRGAALDVHAAEGDGKISPLAELPNVILTPHVGATTVDTQQEIGERIVSIIRAHARATKEPVRPSAPRGLGAGS